MSEATVIFDGVWKKFRRGERHDSLRDLVPALVKKALGRERSKDLQEQEFWAVRDASFEVKAGEALGIIGPNGAGKSTALKLLTRILKPTKGQCTVRGRVGALIEVAAGFHPDLTGRENVYLQGAILGMRRTDVQRRFDEIVEFAGIESFIDTPVKRYSSGMHARLGFAIAAHLNPDVLFIDEVLSVGDLKFQTKCLENLRHQINSGVSVVFVSHNLQAVATLCRRCIVMTGGEKIFDGPVTEALEKYLTSSLSPSTQYGNIDPAFRLVSADFAQGSGRRAEALPPHTACTIDLTFECLKPTKPCCVAFQIERVTDLLYCYGTTSEDLGHPMIEVSPGTSFSVSLAFTAHLARGHYRVNVSLYDSVAGVFLLHSESVASFSIEERISYAGMVEVEPSMTIRSNQHAGSGTEKQYASY